MKTLLLFFSLLTLGSVAQPAGNLIVFTEQGEKFWLVINGVRQNNTAQTNVKVTGLNAPNYKTKIIFEDNNLPDLDKDIYLNQPGIDVAGEYTYNVKRNKEGKYVIRYVSAVPLAQAAPAPQGQTVVVYGTVPHTGTVQTTTSTTTTTHGDQVSVGMNVGGVKAGVNISVNDGAHGMTHTQTVHSTTTTTTTGAPVQVIYVPGYTGAIGCPIPMEQSAFNAARASVANASFESTKSEMAKSIIAKNCLTSAQAAQLVSVFDFESTKLEIAKQAYHKVYDKGNFMQVSNEFEFDSSKEELAQYTGGY